MTKDVQQTFRSGYVSIVGRPNVGKSTLLNQILEQKLSIVSRKPQTTRHQLLGVKTSTDAQIIFIDTPGYQQKPKQALNRYMNRQVNHAVSDVDLALFMVEAMKWTELDELVLNLIQQSKPEHVFLVINKVDKINQKEQLLPFIETIREKIAFDECFPVSAVNGKGVEDLETGIVNVLPVGPAMMPEDSITNRSERFFAAEFLREKLMTRLGDELPYRLTVTIDDFKENRGVYHIHACIWVEKQGQKSIVIGNQGKVLKAAGREARLDMEALFDKKVNLKTWVKVRNKWTDSQQALKVLGYDD